MKKLLIISISLIMISYCSGETSSSNDQVMVEEENEEKDLYIIDYLADEIDVDWLVECIVSKGWDNIPKIEGMGNTVNLIFEGPWDGSLYDSLVDECEEERRADEGDHHEDEGDHQEDEGIEAKKAEEILQENLGSYAGLWQEPGVEWIDFNFNTEYILCDDPDGYCAGWEQDASQECKDNYIFKRNLTQEEQENNWKYERCIYQMVFKPFNPLVEDRTPTPLTQEQKDNAERLREYGWNKAQDIEITFRVASDIPEEIVEASKDGMYKAIEVLGNYGPMRVYYIGNDVDVIDDIILDFCEFNYPDEPVQRCIDDQGQGMREMAYIYPGSNGFAQHSWYIEKPVQSFVHNPSAGENNEFMYELNRDRMVNAHEYFHVYQEAHVLYRPSWIGFGWDIPRWVGEGSAVYFETNLGNKHGWGNRNEIVKESLYTIAEHRARFPGLSVGDTESEEQVQRINQYCFQMCLGGLQYEFGHIAFELLAKKTSPDAIILDFWPIAAEYGWYEAFNQVFSMTTEEFYEEYEEFLRKPFNEQLEELTG
tara:strand:- start:12 stop:1625 length:1614 start_codon:yes stop_codon:yes gene_type:complete